MKTNEADANLSSAEHRENGPLDPEVSQGLSIHLGNKRELSHQIPNTALRNQGRQWDCLGYVTF